MKKLVISANTSWYLFNFRKNTISTLIKKGFSVHVVAPKDDYSTKLSDLGCHLIDIDIDQRGTNPINDFKSILQFYAVYKRLKPAIILNFTPKNNIYSTIAANRLKIPCINNIAGLGTAFTESGLLSTITKLLYRLSQPTAAHIFFQNEDDRSVFLKYKIIDKGKTSRIPGSGVDLNRFTYTETDQSKPFTFLLVARILKEKGILEYVEAANIVAEKHPKFNFWLLGPIDMSNPSSVSIDDINMLNKSNAIQYLGSSDDVENIIQKAHCIVLPSYYREGVPKSLLEGAAMGKPIITSDNVGCKEVVEDGKTGYLCQAKSVLSLTENMLKIANLPAEDFKKMGKMGRHKIENEFDEKIVLNEYLNQIKLFLRN